MKNWQRMFSMAMLVCVAVATFSCSKDGEELGVEAGIVGKWEISSVEELIDGQSPEKFVEQMAQQLGITVEEFEEEYGDFASFANDVQGTLEFKDDKTFTEVINDDEERGSWNAGSDRTLEMKYEDEFGYQIYTLDVRTLKSNSASLSFSHTDEEEIGDSEMEINFEVILHLKR